MFNSVNHVAIIVSDFKKAKEFYVGVLGLRIIDELNRGNKKAPIIYLDAGNIIIELFLFSTEPERLSYPEASGLRHLAFNVDNFDRTVDDLKNKEIEVENIRRDERTGKKMTFFNDPDGLPVEICEKEYILKPDEELRIIY